MMEEFYYELTLTPPSAHYPLLFELLSNMTPLAIEERKGSLILRSDEALDDIAWALQTFEQKSGIPLNMVVEKRENEDWITKYQNAIQPIEVASFYVRPEWEPPKEEKIDIIINPALAFGSGHHETTASCLEALDKHLTPKMRLLDVGCGSGILSIASAKLGASVDICDTDPVAVESAIENFRLNTVTYQKSWVGSANQSEESYDFVIANIIADIILMIESDLKARVATNGILTLSGIIEQHISKVKDTFDDFEILEHIKKGEWHTLVLQKC